MRHGVGPGKYPLLETNTTGPQRVYGVLAVRGREGLPGLADKMIETHLSGKPSESNTAFSVCPKFLPFLRLSRLSIQQSQLYIFSVYKYIISLFIQNVNKNSKKPCGTANFNVAFPKTEVLGKPCALHLF
jgi:hypothetical protein